MDFRLTPEQQQVREAARRFAQSELSGLARKLEETDESLPREMLKRYAEFGFLGINLPAEYGEHGPGHLDAVLMLEG